ncbi:hypothetical protein VIGAN_01230800 [Vigna angularis var. angularis]|uniref:Uncharacterized protein n=1 Tax=Vigna angularis var. angularis TaxID=157739 RepID=A0A0S3R1Z1_PHAAN|nr:hypothetical protein VIGAN_01230800 [Vigna angularis var. angularis]
MCSSSVLGTPQMFNTVLNRVLPPLRTFASTSIKPGISSLFMLGMSMLWLIEIITPTSTLFSSRFLRLEKLTVCPVNHSGKG